MIIGGTRAEIDFARKYCARCKFNRQCYTNKQAGGWGCMVFDALFNSMGNKENMKVRIKTRVYIPEYKSDGAAGMDIRALLPRGSCIIFPGQIELIPTGISLELPKGYEAQVRARSGLSTKHGIGIVSGVGTIDSDYRGEIGVPLINWGAEPFTVNDGDRIAQLVVARCEKVEFVVVDELTETERGTGGFGSTGR